MELKWVLITKGAEVECLSQSYLYGIEIVSQGSSKLLLQCLNRTFMELKCFSVILEQTCCLCLNRTFMELKFLYFSDSLHV